MGPHATWRPVAARAPRGHLSTCTDAQRGEKAEEKCTGRKTHWKHQIPLFEKKTHSNGSPIVGGPVDGNPPSYFGDSHCLLVQASWGFPFFPWISYPTGSMRIPTKRKPIQMGVPLCLLVPKTHWKHEILLFEKETHSNGRPIVGLLFSYPSHRKHENSYCLKENPFKWESHYCLLVGLLLFEIEN